MKKINFNKSIGNKITGIMILCSLIMSVTLGSIGIFTRYNNDKSESDKKLALLGGYYSNNFNGDIKSIENSVNILTQNVAATFDLKEFNKDPNGYIDDYEKNLNNIIKKLAESVNKENGLNTTGEIQGMYCTFNPDLTGSVHEIWYSNKGEHDPLKRLNSDPDPENPYIKRFYPENENMKWYYEPINTKKGIWIEPYNDEDLNIKMVSYTAPVYVQDILIGVIGIDVNISAVEKIIEDIKIYNTGHAFLMNNSGKCLINSIFNDGNDDELKGQSYFENSIKEINKNDLGTIKYNFNGKHYTLGYCKLYNGWILGFTVPTIEVYDSIIKLTIIMVVLMALITCISILFAVYVGKTISNPIIQITQIIKNTARFKFINESTIEPLTKSGDEIGIMAREMLSMQRILKQTGIGKAAMIQNQALQRNFPLPNKADMDIVFVPSKVVSGDYYHLELINDNLVLGVLWDVSGKGVTAALNSSAFNILFHEAISQSHDACEIVDFLNDKIANYLGDIYIAACCFSFDFENNIANIVGAGINRFVFLSEDSYKDEIVEGPFIGMFNQSMFEERIINFKSGDEFYFFTDGLELVIEDDNFKENILKSKGVEDVNEYIIKSIDNKLNNEGDIKDDCTIIALKIK